MEWYLFTVLIPYVQQSVLHTYIVNNGSIICIMQILILKNSYLASQHSLKEYILCNMYTTISFRDQRHPQNTSKNHIMQVSHEIQFFFFQQNLQKIHIYEEKLMTKIHITVEKSLILQIIRRIAEKIMIKRKIHKNAS